MSNRLFLFGIGGTGSRVVKSVAMLMASGIKLSNNFDTLVPILIDPDTANGDLNRTKDILRVYQSIRAKINKPNEFFGQDIKTVNELAQDVSDTRPDYFQFNIKGTHDSKFKDYIGYNSLEENDRNFIDLLYSDKNLNSDLDIGFKGNPHMGSIVLNQFTRSEDFKKFAHAFAPGDAIFIVNSIFGGTGAAGFPLLLKTLRYKDLDLPNSIQIRNAPIGGTTFLPYFDIDKDDDSEIDSDSFKEKAKMALNYYNRSIIQGRKLNALYFLGVDGATNIYENHEGKEEQKNNAHFLELAGALSVVDFCENIHSHKVEEGRVLQDTQIKEFGIERDTNIITFNDLHANNDELLKNNLTRFRLFSLYLDNGLDRAVGSAAWTQNGVIWPKRTLLDKDFFKTASYKNNLKKFLTYFDEWIEELDKNKPSFSPFKKYVSIGNSLDLLTSNEKIEKDGFKKLDVRNAFNISKIDTSNACTQLIKLFELSTQDVLEKNKLI